MPNDRAHKQGPLVLREVCWLVLGGSQASSNGAGAFQVEWLSGPLGSGVIAFLNQPRTTENSGASERRGDRVSVGLTAYHAVYLAHELTPKSPSGSIGRRL
jgi:hypothetical protein